MVSLAAILKIRKLTPFPVSALRRLFFSNSSWPAESLKIKKTFWRKFLGVRSFWITDWLDYNTGKVLQGGSVPVIFRVWHAIVNFKFLRNWPTLKKRLTFLAFGIITLHVQSFIDILEPYDSWKDTGSEQFQDFLLDNLNCSRHWKDIHLWPDILLFNCRDLLRLLTKRLGLQICADLLCTATLHVTSSIIPSCFSADTQYCLCRRGR